ncbi:bacillithiol system redox-active protein YtxJ [Bacillus salitolerans]|uniref:Bacillithiol system redox-active protein YtxJ n=1 Tax=Bacillus salitolerans TaxID=1437434 RepID=A0ABW4LYL4_9BACI
MKTKLSSIEEFQKTVNEYEECLIVKHSLTCPISLAAYEEYEKFSEEFPEIPTFHLFVQDDRPLSNYIAETYSIKHESPQALHFKNNEVIWNASHWKITYDSLHNQLKK